MYKKSLLAFGLITSLLSIMLTSCVGAGKAGPTPTPLPPMVSYEKAVYSVERGPIISEKKIFGEILPSRQDDLYFKASGYVDRVTVKQGNEIKKGDLLAELQVSDLLDQLEQANIDLEVAQASLEKDTTQRQYDMQRAQIDVTISQKNVDLAKIDLANAYTKDDRERAQLHLDILEQNLALAELSLKQAQEQVSTYEQQAVDRSQIAVKRLEALIDDRRIYALYDGIVLRTSLRPGIQINAFDTVITIGDPTELVVRTALDYELNQTMSKNTEIRMYLPNDDLTGAGTPITFMPSFMPISSVEKTTQSTSMSQDFFYFSLPNNIDRTQVKVGVSATLVVVIGRKDSTLLLPPAAIRSYRGQNFVIILDGDRRRRVEINQIGLKSTDKWEVFGDLKEGDKVQGP